MTVLPTNHLKARKDSFHQQANKLPPISRALIYNKHTRVLLTIEEFHFQFLKQQHALVQLLTEAFSNIIINMTGLQQLLKGPQQPAQVLVVGDTATANLLDLLALEGQLPNLGMN